MIKGLIFACTMFAVGAASNAAQVEYVFRGGSFWTGVCDLKVIQEGGRYTFVPLGINNTKFEGEWPEYQSGSPEFQKLSLSSGPDADLTVAAGEEPTPGKTLEVWFRLDGGRYELDHYVFSDLTLQRRNPLIQPHSCLGLKPVQE